MIVCPMASHREHQVRKLFALCHPEWPTPKANEFYAFPTLIAADRPDVILGHTQYSMNMTDAGHQTILLRDTCVDPAARGLGIAKLLMEKRLSIGMEMGAVFAAGVTWDGNEAMLKILNGRGFVFSAGVPGYYKEFTPSRDGLLFLLDLTKA